MAILDAKGRLFGKVSLLDIGAGLVILMVLVGIFLFPGTGGTVAQLEDTVPVEVDLIVRGLTVSDPEGLFQTLQEAETTNIIIRNQPAGMAKIKEVVKLPRSQAVAQPDGTVKSFPDPRPELNYTIDMLITLLDENARISENSPVVGNSPVKIGTQVQIEGDLYSFYTSTVGVRVLDDEG